MEDVAGNNLLVLVFVNSDFGCSDCHVQSLLERLNTIISIEMHSRKLYHTPGELSHIRPNG
jgi:hypothetical protein